MVTERGGWTYNSNYGARRTGDDLQHNYTSDHVSWVPVVTGGVGLRHEVNASGNLHGVGAVETGIPLGDGLGTVRAKSGVEFAPAQWVSLEGGLTATGVWA
ncbi:MAG: hypothetical protein FJX76_29035, partial [Armatimonadetes bacterium]|nr:hypothetical protein [Armatimonadota bacterium]